MCIQMKLFRTCHEANGNDKHNNNNNRIIKKVSVGKLIVVCGVLINRLHSISSVQDTIHLHFIVSKLGKSIVNSSALITH